MQFPLISANILSVPELFTYTNQYPTSQLVRVTHGNGQHLDFTYAGSNLVGVSSPSTNLSLAYQYNGAGQLTNVIRNLSATSTHTRYFYADASHSWITQRVNAVGDVARYHYATNGSGRCTNLVIGTNYYQHSVLCNTGLALSVETYQRNGTALAYTNYYDPDRMRVTKRVGPNSTNKTHEFQYNLNLDVTNETVRLTGSSGNEWWETRRRFDMLHNATNVAVGYCAVPSNYWRYVFDQDWHVPTLITDPEGGKTGIDYTKGQPTRVRTYYTTSASYDTRFSYFTNGVLAAVTNANGHWVRYAQDALGRINQIQPQAGPITQYSNNVLGHLVRLVLPGISGDRVTTFDPDELGRVRRVDYPDSLYETFQFDLIGNLTNHTDRAGRVTRYSYLPTRKLSSVTRQLNGSNVTTSLTYDNQFNTLNIRDALDRPVESYVLDDSDRVVAVTNLEGQAMSIAYGVGDYVRAVTRFDGTLVTNTYEGNGWLSSVKYPDATNSFTYLKNGLLRTAVNPEGTISNTWNFANRLTAEQQVAPNGTVSYAQDPVGNVTNVAVAGIGYQVKRAYDAAERINTLTALPSAISPLVFQHSYHTNNGLSSEVTCTNTGLKVAYGYGLMDQVTNISWTIGTNVLARFDYRHDASLMITQKVSTINGQQVRDSYELDDLDRLVGEKRVEGGSNEVYDLAMSYDAVGNRTQKTRSGISVSYAYQSGCNRLTGWSATSTNEFAPFRTVNVTGHSSETIGTNQYLGQRYVSNTVSGLSAAPSVSGTNFSLGAFSMSLGVQNLVVAIGDQAGNVGYATNMVTLQIVTNASYGFADSGCVMSMVYRGSGFTNTTALSWNSQYQLTAVYTNGGLAESTAYDVFGRRVKTVSGGVTNFMVYDGAQVVADLDATGGVVRSYVWGPGIDNLLAMTVHTGTTVVTYFPIKDHLGTVHALVNGSGTIVERYSFDAWGRVLGVYDGNGQQLSTSAIGNRYFWQGREYSWNTGLYYFRARWYDPITGRWLSNDPIGISGGLTACGKSLT